MKFKKGNKLAGSRKGIPNTRTVQWETFAEYCLNGGLEKFQEELNKLTGQQYVYAFMNLLEFHKPKLARTELTGKDGESFQLPAPITVYATGAPPLANDEDSVDSNEK